MKKITQYFNVRNKQLTFYNIKVGLFILTAENELAKIIHVDERIRPHYPNTRTFTSKKMNNTNFWTSVGKYDTQYEKYILNNFFICLFKLRWFLFKK